MIKRQRKREKLEKLLTAVFTLCALDTSIDQELLSNLIRKARSRALRKVARLSPARRVSVDYLALGHIMFRWQRSLRYLDEQGLPIPVPARGPRPSVEALFREERKGMYFQEGLKHLLRLRQIRRTKTGRFIPSAEGTIFQTLTPELVGVLAQTMDRLVTTVLRNTSAGMGKSVRLIERLTEVPDLRINEIPEFKRFAREQGVGLIDTINEWLERRRARPTRITRPCDRHVTAGVHVFAFVEKNKK